MLIAVAVETVTKDVPTAAGVKVRSVVMTMVIRGNPSELVTVYVITISVTVGMTGGPGMSVVPE